MLLDRHLQLAICQTCDMVPVTFDAARWWCIIEWLSMLPCADRRRTECVRATPRRAPRDARSPSPTCAPETQSPACPARSVSPQRTL